MFGKAEREKMLAEYEHICATHQALRLLVEHLVSEVQTLRNRYERTDGRAERMEYAMEALLDWVRDQNGSDSVPVYPRTQDDIPDLEGWRAYRFGRAALTERSTP